MDELVKLVSQKAGITEEQAQMAINLVVGFLKEKLPAPLAAQVDNLISNGDQVDNVIKGLSSLFGG